MAVPVTQVTRLLCNTAVTPIAPLLSTAVTITNMDNSAATDITGAATTGKATGIVYDGTTTSTSGRPIIGQSQNGVVPTGGGTVVVHLFDGP